MNNYINGLSGKEDVLANSEFYKQQSEKQSLTAEELEAIDRSEGDFRQDEESDNDLAFQ